MLNLRILILLLCSLVTTASADFYFFNATNERFTYEVTLPNGDTDKGEIKESRGYGPSQTNISNSKGDITGFKLYAEDGSLFAEEKAAYARTFIIANTASGIKMSRASWYLDNGQSHKRILTIFNACEKPVTFDLIDEKEMRKDNTLQPGESKTFSAKNGFSGSSGFHHIKFSDGQRLDKAASAGYFVILFEDKRYPNQVRASNSGHVTIPRGITE